MYSDVNILHDSINRTTVITGSSDVMHPKDGFSLTIFGEPLSLARHRSTKAGLTYNPSMKAQRSFLDSCQHLIPTTPLEGPLSASLSFHFKRPKTHYRSHRKQLILKEGSDVYHSKRKDIDNLVKFVLDSLNKIAYLDDSQIAVLQCIKLYTDGESRTEVVFKKLQGQHSSIEDFHFNDDNNQSSRSTHLSLGSLNDNTYLSDDYSDADRPSLLDSSTVNGFRSILQVEAPSGPSGRPKRKPKKISGSL